MCGLAFIRTYDGRDANKFVKKIYFSQKERGTEGFGFYSLKHKVCKRAMYEHQILGMLKKYRGPELLFHHRKPTSSHNAPQQAHPLFIEHDSYKHNYHIIHNGSIDNCETLFKKHMDLGLHYSTLDESSGTGFFNDSESLAHELARYFEGKSNIVAARGHIAFIAVQTDKESGETKKVLFGRNMSRPLCLSVDRGTFWLSSKGNGTDITPHKLFTLDYADNRIVTEDLVLQSGVQIRGPGPMRQPTLHGEGTYKHKPNNLYEEEDERSTDHINSIAGRHSIGGGDDEDFFSDSSAEGAPSTGSKDDEDIPYAGRTATSLAKTKADLEASKGIIVYELKHCKGEERTRLLHELEEVNDNLDAIDLELDKKFNIDSEMAGIHKRRSRSAKIGLA
jgi:hypothetical protein